jgi:hypothetical protein
MSEHLARFFGCTGRLNSLRLRSSMGFPVMEISFCPNTKNNARLAITGDNIPARVLEVTGEARK